MTKREDLDDECECRTCCIWDMERCPILVSNADRDSRVAHLVAENVRECQRAEAAETRLKDFEGDFRAVMAEDGCDDKQHCACVPHLRKALAAAQAENLELREAKREAVKRGDWLQVDLTAAKGELASLHSDPRWLAAVRADDEKVQSCINGNKCRWCIDGELGTIDDGRTVRRPWCGLYRKVLRTNANPRRCAECLADWPLVVEEDEEVKP